MNAFDIFVDSAANLPDEIIDEFNITVLSYKCSIDGKEMLCYEKGKFEETAKIFYQAMRDGAETKTTLVNAQQIIDAVTPTLASGRDALFISIASGISGTYNQALQAAKQLKEQFPDNTLYVNDSFNASLGEGLFAIYAAKMREKGESAKACHDWIEANMKNLHGVFTVGNLKYLKRGGRISATVAIAGTLLNIKPVLVGDETGKLAFWCSERGRKKAISKLAETFSQHVIDPSNQIVAIAHADCLEEAKELEAKVRELGATEVIMNVYDICTGAHAGPGTIALFFLGKERSMASYNDAAHSHSLFKRKVKAEE